MAFLTFVSLVVVLCFEFVLALCSCTRAFVRVCVCVRSAACLISSIGAVEVLCIILPFKPVVY